MEKQKPWQLYLIIAVIALTLYNVFPTIFYYSKPLRAPINEERAHEVAKGIVTRVNGLEDEATAWLESYTRMLRMKPSKIALHREDPRFIDVVFTSQKEARDFRNLLNQAGKLIPFVPSQLRVGGETAKEGEYHVAVERRIGVHFDPKEMDQLFKFSWLFTEEGQPAPLYRQIMAERAAEVVVALAGESSKAADLLSLEAEQLPPQSRNKKILDIAQSIVDAKIAAAALSDPFLERYYANYAQANGLNDVADKVTTLLNQLKVQLQAQAKAFASSTPDSDPEQRQHQRVVERQTQLVEQALALTAKYRTSFNSAINPLLFGEIYSAVEQADLHQSKIQTIDLQGHNPLFQAVVIDWPAQQIKLKLFDDIEQLRNAESVTEEKGVARDKINQFIVHEVARAGQRANEAFAPTSDGYVFPITNLTNTRSLLALDLGFLAGKEVNQLLGIVKAQWSPGYEDLKPAVYPVVTWEEYQKLPLQQRKLGLVLYAPAAEQKEIPPGFKADGIYVIARGLIDIAAKFDESSSAAQRDQFIADFEALKELLSQRGYLQAPAAQLQLPAQFAHDYVFYLPNYYDSLLQATREEFQVKGAQRLAVLAFTDVEQRLMAVNNLEDRIQEDLLKARDDYEAAQVSLDSANKLLIPPPSRNPYWSNFKLSARKYFRGDQNRVLKLGLDLSGGKTVRIGLRDQNGRPVTDSDDLHQVVNELYTRINKMGVSERTIRVEGSHIILDFPGSQGVSAEELVKASSMTFHIVNEKFGRFNAALWEDTNKFLQGIWDEAVVTNRKDLASLNEIAWRHLGGGDQQPRSQAAQALYDNGLRLAAPQDQSRSGAFDDTISMVVPMRGSDFSQWNGQTHPLMVLFHNFALEGANLTNVRVGYEPREGNVLMFEVRSSYSSKERKSGSPRSDFLTWTSPFAKDKIQGTEKESYSGGNGWRMGVVLNDQVITYPTLQVALSDRGQITGHFSQREINQLASDLKAGSLSFTPKILSEENVNPELGAEERLRGITASVVALVAVILAMCGYYRFAGFVACVAVFFNLFILWGILQSLGAALTLPGIAGIVLTIGMAVDANVLVFERYREEFRQSGRLASAIQAGYRKAFSAIVDSNITTIIAALILVQFDSGPIRGFAVTLIIGIIASMFTALFMTRYFFAGWVKNPNHKELTMVDWVGHTHFDFLKQTRKAIAISVVMIVAGVALLFSQRQTIFGMDFTGGYSLTLNLAENPAVTDYRTAAKEALEAAGLSANDIQIQQLTRANQLRLRLGMGLEEAGKPFHGMPERVEVPAQSYPFQANPRIVWVAHALEEVGLQIEPSQMATLDQNWTVMSGQFSGAMRDNAAYGLGLALLAILIYITLRFEFKFAIAAVIGLSHDVLATLGFLALFHMIGLPIEIDLQVIGAIMLIIGYSLNDTIIVFDRLREDLRLLRKLSFPQIINHALNVTLNRTLMTSGTTMLVLLALVLLGGKSIFGFALVMLLGVGIGTLSSLFIAPPMLLYFHNREEEKELTAV